MDYDYDNEMFRLASELVNQSSRNIFLTGKAGTGKTTFLKYIRENCPKQIAVVAPTGVAAINAGGTTMHSFFQLPLSPFIPESKGFQKANDGVTNRNSLISRLRMTTEKKRVLQELELLIIDEISMVRCDMLDAVDTVLRHIRRRHNESFGGVQVLFIGDMFQLPPVIRDQEWNLLKDHYNSPYFFDSLAIKEKQPFYIEFNKIYRQHEESFITVLNQVRNNELDSGRELLEKRFLPGFKRTKDDGYIILTTHNENARVNNESELNKLATPLFSYKAEIKGDFPESVYPAELELRLKVGSQVMFIKNDSDKIKRYYNGKIGRIVELAEEKIVVRCNDDEEPIEVKKEKWENIRYSVDKTSRQLNEEVLGSFTQYPLRLAWSITIHKSQGLTFEKVIIDAGAAFAPGQVYVALSRCRTLDGIVLRSQISRIFTDDRIVHYSKSNATANLLQTELQRSRKEYQLKTLLALFEHKNVVDEVKGLEQYLRDNGSSFNKEAFDWVEKLLHEINAVQETAEKFQKQVGIIFPQDENPEENVLLKERTTAAAEYFAREQGKFIASLNDCPVITDSRIHAKEFNDSLKELYSLVSIKEYLLKGFSGKLDMTLYHQRKKNFVLLPFNVNVYAGASKQRTVSPHPVLHQKLRQLRDKICERTDLPIYIVAGSNTLDEMARYLPQTLTELRKISGFGDAKTEKYGQQFLDIIRDYSEENNLSSLIHNKIPKRERRTQTERKNKTDTKAETFRLYKEGRSVAGIAQDRNLTQQTIEGHLAHYVRTGRIDIRDLINEEKIKRIESLAKDFGDGSITPLKEKLGNDTSYGEIRLVLAWLASKR